MYYSNNVNKNHIKIILLHILINSIPTQHTSSIQKSYNHQSHTIPNNRSSSPVQVQQNRDEYTRIILVAPPPHHYCCGFIGKFISKHRILITILLLFVIAAILLPLLDQKLNIFNKLGLPSLFNLFNNTSSTLSPNNTSTHPPYISTTSPLFTSVPSNNTYQNNTNTALLAISMTINSTRSITTSISYNFKLSKTHSASTSPSISKTHSTSTSPSLHEEASTICQFLFTDTNLNITGYECFESNRMDIAHPNKVCNTNQISYMDSNEASVCSDNKTAPLYPYICYNYSKLCRNPFIYPKIVCLYNFTDNTLCNSSFSPTKATSNDITYNAFTINKSVTLLRSQYNILCMYISPANTYKHLECHPMSGLIHSAIVPQIAKYLGFHIYHYVYSQKSNTILSYLMPKLFGFFTCYTPPCYASTALFYIRPDIYNNNISCGDLLSNTSYCSQVSKENCLISNNNESALCYVDI